MKSKQDSEVADPGLRGPSYDDDDNDFPFVKVLRVENTIKNKIIISYNNIMC